MLIIPSSC